MMPTKYKLPPFDKLQVSYQNQSGASSSILSMLIYWCFSSRNKFSVKIQDDVPLTLLYLSRINSDPDWFKNSYSKLHLYKCTRLGLGISDKKIIPRKTELTEQMVISDGMFRGTETLGIPFRTLPRKRKQLGIPFRGTKIEAYSRIPF
jgi:hypothetical protein